MFILFQKLIPQHLLSRFVGLLGITRFPPIRWLFIRIFVSWYKVNLSEAEREKQNEYQSFNDFFTRRLKSGVRPLHPDPARFTSPADGAVSYSGQLEAGIFIQAKNHQYSVSHLLASNVPGHNHNHNHNHDNETDSDFLQGSFATIYLSPKDYHRVHMPCNASLHSYTYVPGKLFSVNQHTSESIDKLFALNERLVCHFNTEDGPMVLILVGALIVAAIKPAWREDCFKGGTLTSETLASPIEFNRGDELGTFQLGSTVILLSSWRIDWSIEPGQEIKMGMPLN